MDAVLTSPVVAPADVEAPTGNGRRTQVIAILLALIPTVIILVMGGTHRWAADDSYIDFRVVRNILQGHGPVFNVGQRVEAYTNPLWVAILVAFGWLFSSVAIAWWAVILGLGFTGAGVFFASLGAMRLGHRRSAAMILPIGMLCASVIDSMWQFATSGLETGLVFGWIGFSWWLLVRQLDRRNWRIVTAAVLGLGPLIRPDMALFSLSFFVGLLVVMRLSERPERLRIRTVVAVVLAFVALPLLYELFRMAYFGLLVPNTALVKSAGGFWPSQGWVYVKDFVTPNILWLPLLVLGAITVPRTGQWWREGARAEVAPVLVPVIGGLLDALYVFSIGGDFMHARMLLPGFFAISMVLFIDVGRRLERMLPLVIVLSWAGLNAFVLRYGEMWIGANGIANERQVYITMSGDQHPVSPGDYRHGAFSTLGKSIHQLEVDAHGNKEVALDLVTTPGGFHFTSATVNARTPLSEILYAPIGNIGLAGWFAGPNVYIFDTDSLANPIGSHLTGEKAGRPGHDRITTTYWMIAEFTPPSDNGVLGKAEIRNVTAARAALRCQPLAGYLGAIESPMSFSRAMTDMFHSFTWTEMKIPYELPRASAHRCP